MSKFLITLHQLEKWFHHQKRILPWRDHPSLYRVWVSEIMLQQTQVVTVIPYFERFIKRFPRVEDLAAATEEEVLLHWAGLGYYSRARNLHKGAQMIVKKGEFPKTREQWLSIPGVGNYTAGAILSIALNLPEAILDGNVERVISRVRKISRDQGETFYKKRLWNYSEAIVRLGFKDKIRPSILNQSLMELGAMICTPKKPKCLICPVRECCRALKTGQQEEFPPKKVRKDWILIQEKLYCLLNDQGQVLLRKRKSGEWRAGLWDLLEQKPTLNQCDFQFLGEVETQHIVTRHKIQRRTQVWRITRVQKKAGAILKAAESNRMDSKNSANLKWVSLEHPEVGVGSALKKTFQQIETAFLNCKNEEETSTFSVL